MTTLPLTRHRLLFFFGLVKEPVISLYRNTEDSATRIFAKQRDLADGLYDELLYYYLLDITGHTGDSSQETKLTKLLGARRNYYSAVRLIAHTRSGE